MCVANIYSRMVSTKFITECESYSNDPFIRQNSVHTSVTKVTSLTVF
jgi:hypothetical protein